MVHADLSHLSYNDNIVHVSSDKGCHVFLCPRNGMRIAYIPHDQASKMVVKRLMESGSQLENIHQLGGAHALEHFMYKDGEAFSRFNGADLNAWTTTKYIGTHFAGPNHMLDRYLDHQHETMQGMHVGNITQEAFKSEINNIIDEMKRNQAPSACVRRLFEDVNHAVLAQGNTTPTIGLESTLRGLSLQGIKDMQKALMGPSRNFMTIVGSLPEGTSMQDLVDKLGTTFGTLEKNEYLQAMPTPHLRRNSGIRMHEIRQAGGSTMLAMGWPAPAYCKDSDVLKVISSMVSAPDGANSLSKPFQDAGVFYQSNMEANAYTRPDATVFLAAVPASAQNETQQMMRAQAASFNLFGQQLPQFNDGAMLKQTLKRMRNEYRLQTTGDAMQVADSALEGIQANNQPSLSWHYNDRFADNAITCADVRRVAQQYLNENDLIVVRHLQNTLGPRGHLALSPTLKMDADNVAVVPIGEGVAFSPDQVRATSYGAIMTERVHPHSRSNVILSYNAPNLHRMWGPANILANMLNKHNPGSAAMMARDMTCRWSANHNSLVCNMECNAGDLRNAVSRLKSSIDNFRVDPQKCVVEAQQLAALSNSIKFDAQQLSKQALMNSMYTSSDPNYLLTQGERLHNLRQSNGRSVHRLLSALRSRGARVGLVNVADPSVVTNTFALARDTEPLAFKPATFKRDAVMIPVQNTPSCNVQFGQPISHVSPDDAKSIAMLELATMTLGNSFNGRLMSEVRDKMGLTYGIGAQVISNGSFPSLCVSGTFNKNVLQRGIDATNNILSEFSSGKISDQEIETARESMLNMIEANGMNKSYVLRRLVDQLQPRVATDQALRWHTIENVSNDDVRQFVTSTLKPGGFKCTVSGTYT